MEAPSPNSTPHRIPEDLLAQLHAANERFSVARRHVEEAMDDSEYSHQKRVDEKELELRDAERELEEITRKIKEFQGPVT
jgi:hypothetical protein